MQRETQDLTLIFKLSMWQLREWKKEREASRVNAVDLTMKFCQPGICLLWLLWKH